MGFIGLVGEMWAGRRMGEYGLEHHQLEAEIERRATALAGTVKDEFKEAIHGLEIEKLRMYAIDQQGRVKTSMAKVIIESFFLTRGIIVGDALERKFLEYEVREEMVRWLFEMYHASSTPSMPFLEKIQTLNDCEATAYTRCPKLPEGYPYAHALIFQISEMKRVVVEGRL